MKYACSVCTLLLCCLVVFQGCKKSGIDSANDSTEKWFSVTTSDGSMKISFPKKPERQNQRRKILHGDKVDVEILLCESDPAAYSANSTKMPVKPTLLDVDETLQDTIDIQKSIWPETMREITITKDGLKGIEFVAYNPTDKLYTVVRTYCDGSIPRLYQAIVVTPDKSAIDAPATLQFFDSMEFTGVEKQAAKK